MVASRKVEGMRGERRKTAVLRVGKGIRRGRSRSCGRRHAMWLAACGTRRVIGNACIDPPSTRSNTTNWIGV